MNEKGWKNSKFNRKVPPTRPIYVDMYARAMISREIHSGQKFTCGNMNVTFCVDGHGFSNSALVLEIEGVGTQAICILSDYDGFCMRVCQYRRCVCCCCAGPYSTRLVPFFNSAPLCKHSLSSHSP